MRTTHLSRLEKSIRRIGSRRRCPHCGCIGDDRSSVRPHVYVMRAGTTPPSEAERTCPICGTVAGLAVLQGMPECLLEGGNP